MRRLCLWSGLIVAAALASSATVFAEEEPTQEACDAGVEAARGLLAALPADDGSRYVAERHLHQALVEAGNGEFDDCLAAVARATDEIRERRHTLAPGERFKVLQADEVPPR